jgi:peptidoglycan/xylan/chitin deacetylase (PgdA/CDA1 family)
MGTVVLSVDAELGWGFHDKSNPPTARLDNARDGWTTLLDLCDEYDVPATWAIVGHLFLADCSGRHVDHPRGGDWFAHEHPPDRMARDLRYGNGLVEAVQSAQVAHEIATHTFSHVEFGDSRTTRQEARAEVRESLALAHERGIDIRSLVFPRNNIGYLDVLAEEGIRCYRGRRPRQSRFFESVPGKVARATVLQRPPPVVHPYVDSAGLVEVPASLHLFSFEGLPRRMVTALTGDPVVRQARLGIDAVREGPGVFHMWLHPNSITSARDRERVRAIFVYLQEQRADGDIRVATMGEVADEVRGEPREKSREPVERS